MAALAAATTVARAAHLVGALSLLGTLGFRAWLLPARDVARDSVARDRVARDSVARDRVARDRVARDSVARDSVARDSVARDSVARDSVARDSIDGALRRRLFRLSVLSGWLAILAGLIWLALETAAIAGVDNPPGIARAIPLVVAHTRFGALVLARLAVLLLATTAAMAGDEGLYPALLFGIVAVAPEGLISHAGAMGGTVGMTLVVSEAIHVLAAAFWAGGLLPLWLSIRLLPPERASVVCRRFSPVGTICVLALAGTALGQGVILIGSLSGLRASLYGRLVLLKAGLFLLALMLAAVNRWSLTVRLAAPPSAGAARRLLLRSVAVEALLGLAIVVAAAFLASAMPGMDGPMAHASAGRHPVAVEVALRPGAPVVRMGGSPRDVGIGWRSG